MRTLRLALLLLAALSALAACGAVGARRSEPSAPHAAARRHPDPRRWLRVDAARRTVQITLVIHYDETASGLNIDGSFKSALMFVVPVGWTASIRCVNDASAPYACMLTRAPGTTQPVGISLEVPHPADGLEPGSSVSFPFHPREPALYRVLAVRGRPPREIMPAMRIVLKASSGGRPRAVWLR